MSRYAIKPTTSAAEKHRTTDTSKADNRLKPQLESRHVQSIALGAAVGMGLLISSGKALAQAGPLALLTGFALVGTVVFNVMMALAELAASYPAPGAFSMHACRFIDPAWGFAVGWNYALQRLRVLPLELTASAIMIKYWNADLPIAIWITVFWLVVVVISFLGVRGFGKVEYMLFIVKISALIGFTVLGVVIMCGRISRKKHHEMVPWTDFTFVNNGFKGFCSVIVTASFAFSGIEMVGLAAAESKNPGLVIPAATKQSLCLILLSYVIPLFFVALLVPYSHPLLPGNSKNSSCITLGSPFYLAIQDAGIKALPSIFNALILVSLLSVGISSVYGSSRIICAMARCGQAPAFLGYIDHHGRPLVSILVAVLLGGIAYIGELQGTTSCEIYEWLFALSGLSTVVTWTSICLSHIVFRKAWKTQSRTVDELPFKAPFGVAGSWYSMIMLMLILPAQLYISVTPIESDPTSEEKKASRALKSTLSIVTVILMYAFWKVYKNTHFMVPGRTNRSRLELLSTETIDLDVDRNDKWSATPAPSSRESFGTHVWRRLRYGAAG